MRVFVWSLSDFSVSNGFCLSDKKFVGHSAAKARYTQRRKKKCLETRIKVIVVYDSSHRNNRMIAETVKETLKNAGFEVDLFYVKDVRTGFFLSLLKKLYGKVRVFAANVRVLIETFKSAADVMVSDNWKCTFSIIALG
jgi:ABC-type uncharacterized transport system substrate-binding protein